MRTVSKPPSDREPARMAPLAVLPVFFGLHGKSVMVAGGSDAAAWKAELLAAAGATVLVYAPVASLGTRFKQLIADEADRIVHRDEHWNPNSLEGMALAVADAETEAEAAAFREAAKCAGVPVNVIDRPAFCDFQFGSIVNRSPVVVGISTDGAAPILAQAIRRKIETVLPSSLAAWASLAQKLRALVNARVEPGLPRRAFWERFVDRAFGPSPSTHSEDELVNDVERIRHNRDVALGRVTLVGAGPGDAELLTLKALRALQAADVILFDDLVSDAVLELARREAKRILVGKRGGRPSCKQDEISELMVKLARQGKHVVRLKSGDPMIFGRGGEEIERLDSEGIPVEVVPGITAGIALAATLGLSLTHRDFAKSVRFVTGHSRDGGLPEDLDWKQVADPSATTIFYMGGKMAGKIAERLTAMGLPLETPVVIASAVSQPEQRIWHCALSDLTSELDPTTSGPVLIGIGRVFGIRQHSNHPAALTEGRRVAESGMTTMKSRGGLALRRY